MPRYNINLRKDAVPPRVLLNVMVPVPQPRTPVMQIRLYSTYTSNDEGTQQHIKIYFEDSGRRYMMAIETDTNDRGINRVMANGNVARMFSLQGYVYTGIVTALLWQYNRGTGEITVRQDGTKQPYVSSDLDQAPAGAEIPQVAVQYQADIWDAYFMTGYVDINR